MSDTPDQEAIDRKGRRVTLTADDMTQILMTLEVEV